MIAIAMAVCLIATLAAAWFLIRSLRARRAEAAYQWPAQTNKTRTPKARGLADDLPLDGVAEAEEPPRERRRSLAALRAELNENP